MENTNENPIQDRIKSCVESVKYYSEQITALMAALLLFAGVDLSDVASLDASYSDYDSTGASYKTPKLSITFWIKEECKGTSLPRRIASRFHVKLKKEKSPYGDAALWARGETDAFKVTIQNYVPATCKTERVEIPLTPEEIEKARANVPTVKVITRTVCGKVKAEATSYHTA